MDTSTITVPHSRCACGVTTVAGIFRGGGGGGVTFSWILRFVVIHGKKIVVGSDLNHTPHARVELWPIVSK